MTALRREPYRLLFPLGAALFWAGLLHWVLLGLGVIGEYRSVFHAVTQIQGALMCFAAGFLFTFVPRKSQTAPPSVLELALVALAPVGTATCAWFEAWTWAQACWLVMVATLLQFVVRRFRGALVERMPEGFVWVPLSLVAAVFGALITTGVDTPLGLRLHEVGRALVEQGLFSGLILGLGGFLLPVITQGAPAARGPASARTTQLVAALAFFLSFGLEGSALDRLGMGLRALLSAWVLLGIPALRRRPSLPGAHRWWVLLAPWCIPVSSALLALFPGYRRAALHVLFIGGYGTLTLSVAFHVMASHRSAAPRWRRWEVRTMGGMMLAALAARALVDLDQARFGLWLACAAGSMLVATVLWAMAAIRPGPLAPPA